MRALALIGWLVILGTGCTIHVVEQPGVAVAPPLQYQRPPRPVQVARHEETRPSQTPARPSRPSRPTSPQSGAEPRPARPIEVAPKPREPRPTEVAVKPVAVKPVAVKPKPSTKPPRKPVRTVRDAGSAAVGQPGAPLDPHPEHEHESEGQHDRAHDMAR